MGGGENLSLFKWPILIWQLIFHSGYACFCAPGAVFKAVLCISLSKSAISGVNCVYSCFGRYPIPTVRQVGVTSHA